MPEGPSGPSGADYLAPLSPLLGSPVDSRVLLGRVDGCDLALEASDRRRDAIVILDTHFHLGRMPVRSPSRRDRTPLSEQDRELDTVLFDVDDTLFDHFRAVTAGLRRVRDSFPALQRRPLEELREYYNDQLFANYRRVIRGSLTSEDARTLRFQALLNFCGSEATRSTARACGEFYRASYQRSRHPVAGAPALLRAVRARKLSIGLVTNNTREEQEEKLRAIGMDRAIDFMVTSEEQRIFKPDPRIFHHALEQAGSTANQTVMVGDSWDSDVTGAVAAGVSAVWLNRWGAKAPHPGMAVELRSLRPLRIAEEQILRG